MVPPYYPDLYSYCPCSFILLRPVLKLTHPPTLYTMVRLQGKKPAHSTLNSNEPIHVINGHTLPMSPMASDLASSLHHANRITSPPLVRPEHVGIIGAGVAGLRCADVLLAQGVRVTILEGRDRLGGRVSAIFHAVAPLSYIRPLTPCLALPSRNRWPCC
jgi:hypothetical protein